MVQQFKIDLKLHKSSFLISFLVELGGFLFGFLLVNLIMRLDDDPGSWFCMGTLMALAMGVMVLFLMGGLGYSNEFQLALSMGRTRKAFMASYALRLLLQIIMSYILILAVYHLELAIYPLLFPGYEIEVAFSFLTNWKVILPSALAILVLAMFLGAIYGRYGKKGLWLSYLIWMFCCFVLPRTMDDDLGSGVLDQAALGVRTVFTTVPPAAWLVLGGVLAVGMVITTISLGKKQMVKL